MNLEQEALRIKKSRLLAKSYPTSEKVVDIIGVESRGLQPKYFKRMEEIASNIEVAEDTWQRLLSSNGVVTAHQLASLVLRNLQEKIDKVDDDLSRDCVDSDGLVYDLGRLLKKRSLWRTRKDTLFARMPDSSRLTEDYLELGYDFYNCAFTIRCFA